MVTLLTKMLYVWSVAYSLFKRAYVFAAADTPVWPATAFIFAAASFAESDAAISMVLEMLFPLMMISSVASVMFA